MKQIIDFIANINVCYLILNILLLIDIYLYLKQKNIGNLKRRVLLFCGLIVSALIFSYFNSVFQNIFSLKYLSVKSYLLVLVFTNIIALVTINKKVRIWYAIFNYTLFILMAVIFGAIFVIVLGNKIPQFYLMDIQNVVTLIDLSFVIFILYLVSILIIYIGYYIFSSYKVDSIRDFMSFKEEKLKVKDRKKIKRNIVRSKKFNNEDNLGAVLTPEELLGYKDKENFYINGVECGIIFEDSNQDNIVKNYYILLKDIESPMVNGFTLKENKLLKSICTKLNVYDLDSIDIYNLSILNRVSVEEYNFLKKIMGIN